MHFATYGETAATGFWHTSVYTLSQIYLLPNDSSAKWLSEMIAKFPECMFNSLFEWRFFIELVSVININSLNIQNGVENNFLCTKGTFTFQ